MNESKAPADKATEAERQRINAEMARWFGIGITRCADEDCDCGGEWNRWEV